MEQVKQRLSDAELDAKEYLQFEREYEDWCKKYDTNWIIERENEEEEANDD